MKMMDCVEVLVEEKSYTRDSVHKGMQGWICVEDNSNGTWLVNFPQCGEKEDIAEISIKEEVLKVIPVMNAIINEQIKAQFDAEASSEKSSNAGDDDLSGYMIKCIYSVRQVQRKAAYGQLFSLAEMEEGI